MTRRLYLDDPYRTEFEALVVRTVDVDGKAGLVLNQTCFYPTSGGQRCDQGFLNEVPVLDVLERDGEILHVVEGSVEGERVWGRVVWERRFDFMQQHSGQHVLSCSALEVLGADTLSSTLGEEASTIEISRGDLTQDELRAIEGFANKVVFENRTIKTYLVSGDEVARLPLRKIPSRRGPFRIVEVEGLDYAACGGTHCAHTGEIGTIKLGRWERVRQNVRLQFLCGARALADYRRRSATVEKLAERYSAKVDDVLNLVEKQAQENRELRRTLRHLSERLIQFEAKELLINGVAFGEIKLIKAVFDHRPFDEMKSLARVVAQQERSVVLLGNRGDKGELAFSCSEGLPHRMNDLMRDACVRLGGRGGGSPTLAFGGGPLVGKVEEAIQDAFASVLTGQRGL